MPAVDNNEHFVFEAMAAYFYNIPKTHRKVGKISGRSNLII